jgi:hypothetical protein
VGAGVGAGVGTTQSVLVDPHALSQPPGGPFATPPSVFRHDL